MDNRHTADLLIPMKEAAETAGKLQLAEFRKHDPGWGDVKEKKDFVSFVDVESEKKIRCILEQSLPQASFYGEETDQEIGPGPTWVVDPLDGTTNYLSGYDHWSVSIALWEGDHPTLGLVLKPSTGELFTAIRGGGAFRNGEILSTALFLDPRKALIATGTPYRSPDTWDAFFQAMRKVLLLSRDIRRSGSAALDLCYLSAGYFQGFWEMDLKPYDVAAGLLMLSETGHPYSTFSGSQYNPFVHRSFVSARPGVYEALRIAVHRAYASLDTE